MADAAAPAPVFPPEEFQVRASALQADMAQAGLDALLFTTPADIFYLSGFLTRFWESPTRPWFVVLPASGAPVAVIPGIGATLMRQSWIADIRSWPAPFPADDGVSLLAGTLAELVAPDGAIGLPMGPETKLRMPLADFQALSARIAPRRFADATEVVRRVREIKSEAEIAKIRTSCEIAGRAFARMPAIAGQGVPLEEVFRRFQMALIEEGADWVGYLAGGAGPDGYGDVISPASPRPLQAGDVLMLDTGAVREGYFCDYDRNFAIGQASDAARRTQAALWQATEAALAAMRPGMRACDVQRIMRESLIASGVEPASGRMGHGLGIALTEWPSFAEWDETPLRAGMVLTLEPGAMVAPGRMIVHEENLVLREDGAELLSPRAPDELPVIG